MSLIIIPKPLTAEAFAPFGDVLEVSGKPDALINEGMCERYHDRAKLDFSDGRAGISIFDAKIRSLPYQFDLVERHPSGSQAFIPLSQTGFLVIAATDNNETPEAPQAFLSEPGQAINFHRGVWHGVLTPLKAPGLFAVVDRIGPGKNLDEYRFEEPYSVIDPKEQEGD